MNWITGRPNRDDAVVETLRAEITALQDRAASLDRDNRARREENDRLKKRVAELEADLRQARGRTAAVAEAAQKDWWKDRPAAETTAPPLVEGHGVLWQPAADGRIEPVCYCPTCRLVMTPMPSGYPTEIVCTRCKFKAPFRPEQVPELVRKMVNGTT
jgi:hypothetical protein